MESNRLNIDQLYRDKEMQLEALPFGAWDALNQQLHPPKGFGGGDGGGSLLWNVILNISLALSVLVFSSAIYKIIQKNGVITSSLEEHFIKSEMTLSIPKNTEANYQTTPQTINQQIEKPVSKQSEETLQKGVTNKTIENKTTPTTPAIVHVPQQLPTSKTPSNQENNKQVKTTAISPKTAQEETKKEIASSKSIAPSLNEKKPEFEHPDKQKTVTKPDKVTNPLLAANNPLNKKTNSEEVVKHPKTQEHDSQNNAVEKQKVSSKISSASKNNKEDINPVLSANNPLEKNKKNNAIEKHPKIQEHNSQNFAVEKKKVSSNVSSVSKNSKEDVNPILSASNPLEKNKKNAAVVKHPKKTNTKPKETSVAFDSEQPIAPKKPVEQQTEPQNIAEKKEAVSSTVTPVSKSSKEEKNDEKITSGNLTTKEKNASILPLKTNNKPTLPFVFSASSLLNKDKISPVLFSNKYKLSEDKTPKTPSVFLKNLDFGIKAGYEVGTSSNAINKSVFAGYLQYKLSDHLSIVVQPAIKMGNAVGYEVTSNTSYYQLTGTTIHTVFDSLQNTTIVSQHYDSVLVTRNSNKGSNVQVELLLLIKNHLNNHFCFSNGIGINKGALPYAIETKTNVGNFQQTDSFFALAGTTPTIDTTNSFVHTAQVLSQYTPFNGATQSSNPLRISYFASFEYWYKHWMIELAVTQQLTTLSNLNDKNLQNSYQQPYIRISTGWRLGK